MKLPSIVSYAALGATVAACSLSEIDPVPAQPDASATGSGGDSTTSSSSGGGSSCAETCGTDSCVDLANDEAHCGFCDNPCPITCEAGTCLLAAENADALAYDEAYSTVYWSSRPGPLVSRRQPLRDIEQSATPPGTQRMLDIGVVGDKVYYTHGIFRTNQTFTPGRFPFGDPMAVEPPLDCGGFPECGGFRLYASDVVAWTSPAGLFVTEHAKFTRISPGNLDPNVTAIDLDAISLVGPSLVAAWSHFSGLVRVFGTTTEAFPGPASEVSIAADGTVFWIVGALSGSPSVQCLSPTVDAEPRTYFPIGRHEPTRLHVSRVEDSARVFVSTVDGPTSLLVSGPMTCPDAPVADFLVVSESTECGIERIRSSKKDGRVFWTRSQLDGSSCDDAGVYTGHPGAAPLSTISP